MKPIKPNRSKKQRQTRNFTYIAFNANGGSDPRLCNIDYYRGFRDWHYPEDVDFKFTYCPEDKIQELRDRPPDNLYNILRKKLEVSSNLVLLIGPEAKPESDLVRFEIEYAIDHCKIPVIAAYVDYMVILSIDGLRDLWPPAFEKRISNGTVRAIHVPFARSTIFHAIRTFDADNPPASPLVCYTAEEHENLGIAIID